MKVYPICSESILCGTPTPFVDYPFYIDFYKNNSELNKLDKKLKLINHIKGILREQCSINNPVILVNLTGSDMNSEIFESNYAYIENFNRYYFINDITNIRENIWQISLRCDVLMSYKEQIKSLSGLISRNENEYDNYVEDDRIFMEYKEDIKEYNPKHILLNSSYSKMYSLSYLDNSGTLIESSVKNSNYVLELSFTEGFYSSINIKTHFSISFGGNPLVGWAICSKDGTPLKHGTVYSKQTESYSINETIYIPKNASMVRITNDNNDYSFIIDDSIKFNPNSSETNTIIIYSINNKITPKGSYNKSLGDGILPTVDYKSTDKIGIAYPFVIDVSYLEKLSEKIKVDDVSKTFILSTTVYPFEIPIETNAKGTPLYETISLGDKTFEGIFYGKPTHRQSPYLLHKRFKIESKYNSFLDYNPYSRYEIYIPYANWISVDPQLILDKELKLFYVINYADSSSYYILTTPDKVITMGSANLGDDISLSSTNKLEIDKAREQQNANMILGGINGGINAVGGAFVGAMGGMAVGGPVGAIGGAITGGVSGGMQIANSITQGIMNKRQLFVKADGHVTSGTYGLYTPQELRVRITRMIPMGYDKEFAKLYGKPLNKVRLIGDMKGYTEILNVHVDGVDTATFDEQREIEDILKGGIII